MDNLMFDLAGAVDYATKEYVELQIARALSEAQAAGGGLPAGGSPGDFLMMTGSGPAWVALPDAESEGF